MNNVNVCDKKGITLCHFIYNVILIRSLKITLKTTVNWV